MSHHPRSASAFVALALPLLWIGIVLGVSFIATPAKFKAGPMGGALALSISVVTFAWLHMAETVLAIALVLALLVSRAGRARWLLLAVAAIALILEVDWILPAFEGRTGLIPLLPRLGARQLHMAFAAFEGTKILALLALAFIAFRGSDVRQDTHSDESAELRA